MYRTPPMYTTPPTECSIPADALKQSSVFRIQQMTTSPLFSFSTINLSKFLASKLLSRTNTDRGRSRHTCRTPQPALSPSRKRQTDSRSPMSARDDSHQSATIIYWLKHELPSPRSSCLPSRSRTTVRRPRKGSAHGLIMGLRWLNAHRCTCISGCRASEMHLSIPFSGLKSSCP
jgi:hypothetical protein